MQSKLCRLGIGWKILATAIGNKITKAKSKAFDSMKLHYFAFDKNNSNADEGFHLFKANDQSEIIAVSDHDDDGSCDGDRHMSNILSKMDGEDNSNIIKDNEALHGTIHEEAVESSIGNTDNSNNQDECDYSNRRDEEKESSKMNFHSKLPLSIDIWNTESDEENEKVVCSVLPSHSNSFRFHP